MEKSLANQHFINGNYDMAVKIYSELLTSDPLDCCVLSNRSAAYIKMEQYDLALEDAVKVTKLRPDWGKAWGRLGAALYGLNNFTDGLVAYNKANELDPSSIYTKMIIEINKQLYENLMTEHTENLMTEHTENLMEQFPKLGNNMIGELFNNLYDSVFANPTILEKLSNQDFQKKVLTLQANPLDAMKDNEIMGVVGEMMKGLKL